MAMTLSRLTGRRIGVARPAVADAAALSSTGRSHWCSRRPLRLADADDGDVDVLRGGQPQYRIEVRSGRWAP
jgi:hypothetical protein